MTVVWTVTRVGEAAAASVTRSLQARVGCVGTDTRPARFANRPA